MVTYFYWAAVIALVVLSLFAGSRLGSLKAGAIFAGIFFLVGWFAYYFHFEQVFVKRFGGVMYISVPKGQRHIGATWKDDNLWVENYDPETNRCIFSEYSKGNLLEGRVIIRDCNPLLERDAPRQ
ncbi:hypothetical protein OQJ46_15780 [Microbulbifer thermotolerans]|uniref:Uncharacterized protein n=2 Tax=Microbulbifer thermotolerans TaxID=252514 RepID=A0A143HR11_MICTH|nr:hypothetical protein [Microbulbifer thermotolerans]AMX04173.1 hypothetical protein A3224_09880 [Microbulbifer thermotolerans]MCX2781166.1 hypothetical protein [Microbulbifer thermotolerans]MCX2784455.1 hypothetical protein [Microbulbifer thermotolerans]MCX2796322.1 hypothetical protein [Microbulbifer thermotolerans]MCX2803139.1 hypothetical protein [Microbulbifer thermotolerans]